MKKILIAALLALPMVAQADTSAAQLDCKDWGRWYLSIGSSDGMRATAWLEKSGWSDDIYQGNATPINVNVERDYNGKTEQILINRVTLVMKKITWLNINTKESEESMGCTINLKRQL